MVEYSNGVDQVDEVDEQSAGADTYTVVLTSEVDFGRADELRRLADAFRDSGARDVVVDLGQVTFFDSTGLAFLVSLSKGVAPRGGTVVLLSPQEQVVRVLRLVAFDRLFEITR